MMTKYEFLGWLTGLILALFLDWVWNPSVVVAFFLGAGLSFSGWAVGYLVKGGL